MLIKSDCFPLISIVMPVYNVAPYLKECIESVLNQTYQNFELIIINDGSTDDSLSVIKEMFPIEYPSNIKVIQTENNGLAAARNLGIKKAIGEYLFFLDSDDFLETEFLEEITHHIINQKCDVIIFNYRSVSESGNKQQGQHSEYTSGIFTSEKLMINYLEGNIQNYAWSYVATKNLYQKNNIIFPANKAYEDIPVFPKILYFAEKIQVIRDVLYNYRQREQSITKEKRTQKTIKYLSDYLSNVEYNRKWMLQHLNPNYKINVYKYCINHYFQILMIARKDDSFPYNKLLKVMQCIKRDARYLSLNDISFKKLVFIYAVKLGLGRLCFSIIKFQSKSTT